MVKVYEHLRMGYDNLCATYLELYFGLGKHSAKDTALHGKRSFFITQGGLEEFSKRFSVAGSKALGREMSPDHLMKLVDQPTEKEK
jgi:hypothetical protein